MAESETLTTVASICDMNGPRRTTATTRRTAGSSFVLRSSAVSRAAGAPPSSGIQRLAVQLGEGGVVLLGGRGIVDRRVVDRVPVLGFVVLDLAAHVGRVESG